MLDLLSVLLWLLRGYLLVSLLPALLTAARVHSLRVLNLDSVCAAVGGPSRICLCLSRCNAMALSCSLCLDWVSESSSKPNSWARPYFTHMSLLSSPLLSGSHILSSQFSYSCANEECTNALDRSAFARCVTRVSTVECTACTRAISRSAQTQRNATRGKLLSRGVHVHAYWQQHNSGALSLSLSLSRTWTGGEARLLSRVRSGRADGRARSARRRLSAVVECRVRGRAGARSRTGRTTRASSSGRCAGSRWATTTRRGWSCWRRSARTWSGGCRRTRRTWRWRTARRARGARASCSARTCCTTTGSRTPPRPARPTTPLPPTSPRSRSSTRSSSTRRSARTTPKYALPYTRDLCTCSTSSSPNCSRTSSLINSLPSQNSFYIWRALFVYCLLSDFLYFIGWHTCIRFRDYRLAQSDCQR